MTQSSNFTIKSLQTNHFDDWLPLWQAYLTFNVRGQGLGRALIQHVYAFANDTDCNRVYWTTQEHNLTAPRLYDTIATKTDMVQYRHNFS